MHITLVPAYGRDYKSKGAVKAALLDDADFLLMPEDVLINLSQIEGGKRFRGMDINVRYGQLRKVCVFPGGKVGRR